MQITNCQVLPEEVTIYDVIDKHCLRTSDLLVYESKEKYCSSAQTNIVHLRKYCIANKKRKNNDKFCRYIIIVLYLMLKKPRKATSNSIGFLVFLNVTFKYPLVSLKYTTKGSYKTWNVFCNKYCAFLFSLYHSHFIIFIYIICIATLTYPVP